MAGDWLKWTKGLTQKDGVIRIARQLGISRREAACCCMEVWEWADSNTTDGAVAGVPSAFLDEVVSITGFGAAMKAAGWLLEDDAGGIVFPNFDRHNTNSAKKRALAKERMARKRSGE